MANRAKQPVESRQDLPLAIEAERFAAWQCIGCGRIEGAQPCIGVCEDRRAVFVHAAEYDRLLAAWSRARADRAALRALLRQLAATTPRDDAWASGYRAFQARARSLLRATAGGTDDAPA
jgi:hypothetical protein